MTYWKSSSPDLGHQTVFALGEKTKYTGLEHVRLAPGTEYSGKTENFEALLVIIGGTCDIKVAGETYENLGTRKNVFAGAATSVYVPIQSSYQIIAKGD